MSIFPVVLTLLPVIAQKLQEAGLEDVLITAGGIIPDEDIPTLQEMGIHGIFTPGASTQEIIDFINNNFIKTFSA